ncbi:inositol hexakisphosphate kinase 3 [Thraustotheca clavata]|uniref:Kinase n=1 Tax=Thraustotheca clavata TaxID=74557 RepID=A0A1V9ZZA6_9STRA|nr:inositol hexakisphosphate kinase 3 [Thraustotheca clavata]
MYRLERSLSGDSHDSMEPLVARSTVGTAYYLFSHQVGGHKPFLRSAPGEVCKPAIPLELAFYKALDIQFPHLKEFVPVYKGTLVVDLQPCSCDDESKSKYSNRKASRSLDMSFSYSLWNKECGKSNVETYNEPSQTILCKYLVLGDLTQGYNRPCVLDIKMGTRQHGEDATEDKILRHTQKCNSTTSAELGLRLCGMQIYRQCDGRYVLRDKHWGRKLRASDIEPALLFFLSNGQHVRTDAIQALLQRLNKLKEQIISTIGIRFWGSSLLLVYEGDSKENDRMTDVRLIDFAHCHQDASITTPDEGLILGLTNLITFLTNLLKSPPNIPTKKND